MNKAIMDELIKNEYGFYQVKEYPNEEEIKEYYEKKYYSDKGNGCSYSIQYDDEELIYIKERAKIWLNLVNRCSTSKSNTMLDMGCGEGFSMKYFHESGYKVSGNDYSNEGILRQNPEMIPYFEQGDLLDIGYRRIEKNEKYDVILMQNVLEHVTEPKRLLQVCYELLNKNGLLLIEVPNDFNNIQEYLYNNRKINERKWVCLPDHLSYFNREGLNNLCTDTGFSKMINLCTEFIELFGFNEDSNYFKYPEKGHNCHVARMKIEKLLHEISLDKSIDLYEKMAELGIGRNLLGVYMK